MFNANDVIPRNYYTCFGFKIHFVILILSGCTVDGAEGDGTQQGTCATNGTNCQADGSCGMYY